jgi:hypothetical protein
VLGLAGGLVVARLDLAAQRGHILSTRVTRRARMATYRRINTTNTM